MTKREIKVLIKEAIKNVQVANLYLCFDAYYFNIIPLASNDKLFLSIKEDDFIFDGYKVFRFKDVNKVKVKHDMCDDILRKEGLISNITTPPVDITNWKTVFESLKRINKNIIVEKQTIDGKNSQFVIGRIEKIYNKFAYVWHFDADGVWEDEPYKIPYSEITNISFGNRYVEIFSKYIDEPPFLK